MGICIPHRAAPIALTLTLALITVGCGAIFNGTRQTITAASSPAGAKVTADPAIGEFTTPASLSLERKNNYILRFELEGYRPATFNIDRRLQAGILVLDVLFTGLLGVVVDAATGAWYKLSPENAVVALTKLAAGDGPEKVYVYVTRDGNTLRLESTAPGVRVRVQPEH